MLSVKQVADRLNVSVGTIYGLVSRGRLTAFRIGVGRGILRIPEESVRQLLQSSRVEERLTPSRLPSNSGSLFKHLDAERLRDAWRDQGVV